MYRPNKYEKLRNRDVIHQNKALLGSLLNIVERRNEYTKSPLNYERVKQMKTKVHYYKESNQISQTNSNNNKMMKKLLKAKCGVKPVMKGPEGWEKHATNYYH